ncbi:MAG TPA: radical SAM protein, partial [Desulfomonilia bacterium]|nr:radical SAM protein [Desulfomonilia bacterium]
RVIDANLEGLMHLLSSDVTTDDTWTRRASLHLEDNLASLRSKKAFANIDRYTKVVTEISHILDVRARAFAAQVNLNNFQHDNLSPLKSTDLIRSAEHPEDNVFSPYFEKRISAALDTDSPRIVGFSLNYLSQVLTTFAMIGLIRRVGKDIKIILGGGLVTSWMRRPGWRNAFTGLVDEFIAGPGEDRILALSGAESHTENTLPDYTPLRHHPYLSPVGILPFSTSSGCYWSRCSFCPEKAEGNRYTGIPAEQVPGVLDALVESNSPGLVHITDNAMSPGLLTAMSDNHITVPWYGFSRFTRHLADGEFCTALRKSGCVMLQLGLESGDQAVLDELGKGIRIDDAAGALAALHDAGIATYVYLLFGTPSEDEARARKTLDFVAGHSQCIDFLNVSIFNLPRGSDDSQSLETYDFSDGDLSLYQGFVHPRGWGRNRVRRYLDREFKRHPAVARIIRRDPPFFTSNHAPFFKI